MSKVLALAGVQVDPVALEAVCATHGVRYLDVFGSATGARFDPVRSDIDLIVGFQDGAAQGGLAGYFALQDALERLFRRKVDLVTEHALRNPYFRRQVDRQRSRIYPG